jgi:signal transduction histidine kinase
VKSAPLRGLIVAVVFLFAGTAALVVLLSCAAADLASTNEVIANRAAPSIVALQTIRADVQQEHALVDEWVLGAPGDSAIRRARMDALRREATQSRHDYLALPPPWIAQTPRLDTLRREAARSREAYLSLHRAPGDATPRAALMDSLDHFDSVVDRFRALPPGDGADTSGALYELDAAVGQVGGNLARATDFWADVAKAASSDAKRVSRTLLPSAILLGIVSAAAAVGTILLTFRSVRRADALAEASRRALERKAEELEAFAGRVAHDLLSPLMTVGLGLDLAQRRAGGAGPRTTAAIARASATLLRVRAFVSDLLEFARSGAKPHPGTRTSVDGVVRDVAEEFEPIAQEAHVELHVESATERDVRCSAGVLTSLVSNLVENAVKYLVSSDTRLVVVRALDLGKVVRVEVEDTGPGIAPSDQETLFDPFVRGPGASGSGVGLGLATVRRLAEAHGGHAGVRSEPGHGSVFWFSIPSVA